MRTYVLIIAYPEYLRLRARELRVQRLTLDEIVERLVLPRTTISEWIKDLPLGKPRSTAGQVRSRLKAWIDHIKEVGWRLHSL